MGLIRARPELTCRALFGASPGLLLLAPPGSLSGQSFFAPGVPLPLIPFFPFESFGDPLVGKTAVPPAV